MGLTMEFNHIKQLASLMKEMGLTSLEYSEGEANIRMERCQQQPQAPVFIETKAEVSLPQTETNSDYYTVNSPMVGVYYAAPAADKKPYVTIGDKVNVGDVLCIIEAMKMMNEITSEKSGVIKEICVGNKQIVEYGHPLFRISPE